MEPHQIGAVTVAIILREALQARPEDEKYPSFFDICDIVHTLKEAKYPVGLYTHLTGTGQHYSDHVVEVVGNYYRFGIATQLKLDGIRLTPYGREAIDRMIARAWLENPEEIHAIRMKVKSLVR